MKGRENEQGTAVLPAGEYVQAGQQGAYRLGQVEAQGVGLEVRRQYNMGMTPHRHSLTPHHPKSLTFVATSLFSSLFSPLLQANPDLSSAAAFRGRHLRPGTLSLRWGQYNTVGGSTSTTQCSAEQSRIQVDPIGMYCMLQVSSTL